MELEVVPKNKMQVEVFRPCVWTSFLLSRLFVQIQI